MNQRPPIVTVLGHVDHGKTTLLDTLRATNVAAREAGGITQGIGASTLNTPEGIITFIDTPGHEAFSQMRKNGAALSDVSILVVAADDGPMPQTKEALSYLQDSKTPFIVALTKIDLPSASVEKALSQLEQIGVFFEGRGGDVPYVEVSAKEKKGLDALLEMIHLVSQVNEVSGDKDRELVSYVIETNIDRRGPVVSCVIKNGQIKKGDEVYVGKDPIRIKGLFDEHIKQIESAGPGMPVALLGFTDLPDVGALITKTPQNGKVEKDEEESPMQKDQFPIIVKVKSAGSIDAIRVSLPENVYITRIDIGDVNENDVFFAKSTQSRIFAFEVKVPNSVKKLADTEDVEIHIYSIIYAMIEDLQKMIESTKDTILGRASVLATFPFNKMQVAGCKVLEGEIKPGAIIKVLRGEKEIGESKIVSLRRGKNEIDSAKPGEECGILMRPQLNFDIDDIILAIKR